MRMARWIVGICLLRLLGAEPEHHGPFARTTKCLPFKFSPWIWGSKTSKPFNQSTPSCNFMWLRSPNANSIPVFFLLVRTLGKDFDTFIQPGRCKGWMSPWNMALNVMLWFLSFTANLRDCFCWFSRQSSQHKENASLNPPFFGFHVRLGWVYM